MERVKDEKRSVVHFKGLNGRTLCGLERLERNDDLFASAGKNWPDTSESVNCPDCAKLYCRIKNAPWNEVDGDILDAACYTAVKPDTEENT